MGAVCYQRFGCPDMDVYRSRFEPSSCLLGPLVVESLPLGYKSIQGAFQELWREWLRVGRGIGDSSATWSGASRTLARARRS
jgi:hypothetical protein